MKKVLILMVTGGGGHGAGAAAIASALGQLYGQAVTTSIVDVTHRDVRSPVGWLDDLYRWLARDGLWLWKILWWTDGRPQFVRRSARLLVPLCTGWMGNIFSAEKPDLVVSVHGLVNHIPQQVLHSQMPQTRFATVVLDLASAHPVWFCPEADLCLVPTDVARERALRFGMSPEKVEVVGLPVDLRFVAPVDDRAVLRARLRLDPARPCVLVVGGGDGVGALYETAQALSRSVPGIQLVVVAGRNKALRRQLEQSTWPVPAQIHGFVQNMPELMAASDLLVTKAGSVTLSEAFVVGLPVIIYGFVPGQEEGNIGYVREHGAGAYAPTPDGVAEIARAWLEPGNPDLHCIAANAHSLARPEASLNVARRLYALLQEQP
jgi:1,2-diacylglycerol 3-beta-galactosyltransferase